MTRDEVLARYAIALGLVGGVFLGAYGGPLMPAAVVPVAVAFVAHGVYRYRRQAPAAPPAAPSVDVGRHATFYPVTPRASRHTAEQLADNGDD